MTGIIVHILSSVPEFLQNTKNTQKWVKDDDWYNGTHFIISSRVLTKH